MATSVFQDPTKSVPKSDEQIVRVDMQEQQIGGRLSSLPQQKTNDATISHVPNAGSKH
jgi:hypothetical protein